MLVQLEMQKIFHGKLKASKFSQSRIFKIQKFPKDFSHHLHGLLVFLRDTKLKNYPNNVSTRNLDEAMEFMLFFLADVPNRFIDDKMLNEVLEKVGAIVGDILFVIQKLLPSSTIEDDTSKINLCLIPIVEKTENLKAQEEKYYKSLEFTHSQFPNVGGLSFLDSLLRKLNEVLKSESSLDFMLKAYICILQKELSSLTTIFRDVAKVHHEKEFVKHCQWRTINLAYEVEVSIDSILAQYNSLWHIFCSLPTILKEIRHISEEVTEMWLENLPLKLRSAVEPSTHVPTQHINPLTDEEIVGFESDAEKLIQCLVRGTDELDVISIVGMGGQGKTTIARNVYNNSRIVSRFDVRVWCCVSQTYNRIGLLHKMYSQVTGSKDEADKYDDVADTLRKRLMGKRYLIVLDDIWDVKAWEDLRFSFPNRENGSRIMVTTRLEEVGTQIKEHTDPYFLPFLTPEESSKLLQKKVFQRECLPYRLYDVCLSVAERCKGLPLALVLVAGIIQRKKMEASWWHEVKNSLLSYLGESEEYSLSTMQLSYDNLPDYLRPCFLYMGMFPEDARIPVSKLISLWIAEGFVQNIGSGTLEEEAERYLMDLISSNVVTVSKRRYNGKVKYCQVHDVVLHFCVERSREENFMLEAKGRYSQLQPYDWKVSRLKFSFTNELTKISSLVPKAQNLYHQQLRSLIITNEEDFSDCIPFPQVQKLRILRVLDLSSHQLHRFSTATLHPLIHLKYLAVSTHNFHFHPEKILSNLETMILKAYDVSLPATFWKMEKLRRVEIGDSHFDLEKNRQQMLEESSELENLRILRNVEFQIDDADCMDVLLGRFPNLQELGIHVYGDSEEISTLSFKLESLNHLILRNYSFLSELHLPSNLKKLVLEGFDVVTKASLIAGLPCLEYLKLAGDYRGWPKEWCLRDITFAQLKFLKLVNLGISKWDASEASFPMLETLVIISCYSLRKIPPSFADIQSLKQIKLLDTFIIDGSLVDSTMNIKMEVEEMEGCDRIEVLIGDQDRNLRICEPSMWLSEEHGLWDESEEE